jgi:hypothetical protein
MIQKLGKVTVALLIANLALWVYFWAAFALASEPYDPRPWGHFPIDPYSVWGYAIGLKKSAFMYPFMKVIFWAEFPSVLLVTLIQRVLFSKVSADAFFLGISAGGLQTASHHVPIIRPVVRDRQADPAAHQERRGGG